MLKQARQCCEHLQGNTTMLTNFRFKKGIFLNHSGNKVQDDCEMATNLAAEAKEVAWSLATGYCRV